jgi:hypothetical protein
MTRLSVANIALGRVMASALALSLLAGAPGVAQSAAVVPLKGQTPDQAAADQQQCAAQASGQTGYNPAMATTQAAAPTPQLGQRAGGALRGAAAGKVISNVNKNNTDDAMEAGAKLGAMAGGGRQRRANRDQRQQTQQQQAAEQQKASAYNSSLSACLQARGYALQ